MVGVDRLYQALRGGVAVKQGFEARHGSRPHVFALAGAGIEPAMDEARSADLGVFVGKSGPFGDHRRGDIDRVRNEYRKSDGQRFNHGDAEIFLVREERENLGGFER
jgi:hypothetical protein